MLALMQLSGFGGRRPDQLSGGSARRRACPFARKRRRCCARERSRRWTAELREETRFELTDCSSASRPVWMRDAHDQDEAMALADRIAVMARGRIGASRHADRDLRAAGFRWVANFVGT